MTSSTRFLESLASALGESLNVITRLPIQQRFAKRSTAQFNADIEAMNALVDGIIAERRANPREAKDLLNLMIHRCRPGKRASGSTISTFVTRC